MALKTSVAELELVAAEKASERAFHESFRSRLKTLRDDLGWSQPQMAKVLGVPLVNYKKYETRSKFPPHLYEQLALATHKSLDFIVTGRDSNVTAFSRRRAS